MRRKTQSMVRCLCWPRPLCLTADAPPAFAKHSVGGKLRAGEQGSADAAAIAGKGKLCQNIAEWVVVEIYLAERSGVTVLDDPIAIVKR